MKRGAVALREPHEEKDDHGSVVLATIRTYGDTVHTFVERKNYKGVFLPGFQARTKKGVEKIFYLKLFLFTGG